MDENLPKKLKLDFENYQEVFTEQEVKWNGKKNGELLGLITISGFEVFITIDKNLKYQQNPDTVFLLNNSSSKHQIFQNYIPQINLFLQKNLDKKFYEINF